MPIINVKHIVLCNLIPHYRSKTVFSRFSHSFYVLLWYKYSFQERNIISVWIFGIYIFAFFLYNRNGLCRKSKLSGKSNPIIFFFRNNNIYPQSFRSGVRSDSRGSPLCGRSRLHPRLSLACGFHLLTLRSCAPPQGSLVFFRRRS